MPVCVCVCAMVSCYHHFFIITEGTDADHTGALQETGTEQGRL